MPIGDNQLNVYLFEVGLLTRQSDGTETARTLAIHPLLVAPTSIRYSDSSRSTIMQTTGGAIDSRGGRALRQISMDGSFGVEDRRVGPWGGSGEERFRSFRAEVVRLGDALTAAQVRAAVGGEKGNYNPRIGSPGLRDALKSFNDRTDILFVNLYDFWENEDLQVVIRSFNSSREARGGGATGLVRYNMALDEVGPAISTGPARTVISGLMDFLTTWQGVNRTLASYDPIDVIGGGLDVGTMFLARVDESLEAIHEVGTASFAAMGLLSGDSTPAERLPILASNSAGSFFGAVNRAVEATRYSTGTETLGAGTPSVDRGEPNWADPVPTASSGLARLDLAIATQDVLDALALQLTAGSFFGMSPAEYRAWVESDGLTGMGPSYSGSLEHVATETDTESYIEQTYGIPWSTIMALNNLTTEEAMLPGTAFQVPIARPAGPQGLEGLPTFGSHLGQSAWGVDLNMEEDTDDDGDLAVLSGPDVIRQGVDVLFETFGAEILGALDTVPDTARTGFVAAKLRGLLLSDPRIVSLSAVDVVEAGDGAIQASILAHAINGGTVSVGGPA